jgi:hypothetical protein
MASSQANIEQMRLRQSYRNVWHTNIMSTMQADFPCMQLPSSFSLITSPGDAIWSPAGNLSSDWFSALVLFADCCLALRC